MQRNPVQRYSMVMPIYSREASRERLNVVPCYGGCPVPPPLPPPPPPNNHPVSPVRLRPTEAVHRRTSPSAHLQVPVPFPRNHMVPTIYDKDASVAHVHHVVPQTGSAAVPVGRFRSFARVSTSTSPRDFNHLQVHRTFSSPRSQTYTNRPSGRGLWQSPREVEVRTVTGTASRNARYQGQHVQTTLGRLSGGRSSYGSSLSGHRLSRSPDGVKNEDATEDMQSPVERLGKPVVSQRPPASLSDHYFTLKKDRGALSSSTMAPDEAQSPEQVQVFRSEAPEAARTPPQRVMPSEAVIPSEPVTLPFGTEKVKPVPNQGKSWTPPAMRNLDRPSEVLNVKAQATRTVAPADVQEARTPEGVTTKHPPRRPVKGRRLSKNESARLSVKEEQKSIPNERRLSATTEDARKDPGRLLCDERRVSTRAEGQHQDPGGPAFAGAPIPRVTREATGEPEAAQAPVAPAPDFPEIVAKIPSVPAPAQETKDFASSGSFLPWALKSLNEGQAAKICSTDSLDQLTGFELRVSCPTCKGHCPDHVRCRQRAEQAAFRRRAEGPTPWELKGWEDGANQPNLGTWMVWMVHRVYLNDPSLESLDFGCFHVPRGDQEPRILPKLFKALASNTHLKHLMLGNTALESDKVCISQLGGALRANSTLEKLDLQANFLEMCDLAVIFEALAENTGLKDLKVNFQACAKQSFRDLMLEQGNDVYKAAAAAFRSNRSLVKLDLILLQRHWQDQICRGLMQNRQELRKSVVPKAGG